MLDIAAIVLAAAALTGQPCAAIDNVPNAAAWARPHHGVVSTSYTDRGDYLQFKRHVPRGRTLEALKRTEDGLGIGKPGPKFVLVCA